MVETQLLSPHPPKFYIIIMRDKFYFLPGTSKEFVEMWNRTGFVRLQQIMAKRHVSSRLDF